MAIETAMAMAMEARFTDNTHTLCNYRRCYNQATNENYNNSPLCLLYLARSLARLLPVACWTDCIQPNAGWPASISRAPISPRWRLTSSVDLRQLAGNNCAPARLVRAAAAQLLACLLLSAGQKTTARVCVCVFPQKRTLGQLASLRSPLTAGELVNANRATAPRSLAPIWPAGVTCSPLTAGEPSWPLPSCRAADWLASTREHASER